MVCLFLENVPPNVRWNKARLKTLHRLARRVLKGDAVEVHVRNVSYTLLTHDGEVSGEKHGVHGFIYWREGRSLEEMQSLGDVIQELLDGHEIGEGFDLTFIAGPLGHSFYFNRRMVEK